MSAAREGPRLISVVVPILNGAETLPHQLRGLLAQDYAGAFEVVVADNGSTDGSGEVAERLLRPFGDGRVVRADGPRSASHARNVGARHARGDFLAFTDCDDVPAPGWLSSMARAAPNGDLVAGDVDVESLSEATSRSWHSTSPRELALASFRFLTYASGTNTGVWADVFEHLGGFDEGTAVGEDIELSWRAQLAAYRVASAPEAVVRERLRRRLGAATRQQYRYGTAGPALYRSFRDAGMPRAPLLRAARTWLWILAAWPAAVRSPERRGRWALGAAYAAGRLAGSARNRVLYL
jgi:glycosyltransferase involved in cell wall biosynthesis